MHCEPLVLLVTSGRACGHREFYYWLIHMPIRMGRGVNMASLFPSSCSQSHFWELLPPPSCSGLLSSSTGLLFFPVNHPPSGPCHTSQGQCCAGGWCVDVGQKAMLMASPQFLQVCFANSLHLFSVLPEAPYKWVEGKRKEMCKGAKTPGHLVT